MAWAMKFVKILHKKRQGACSAQKNPILTVQDLQEAEVNVLRNYQQSEFQDAYKILRTKIGNNHTLGSNIACLNPFLDSDGLIRVGGRLKQSFLEWSIVYPILLPRKGSITKLIVKCCHEKAAHSGRNITLNKVRSSRYWVLQGNLLAKQKISKCVTCRRLRGRVEEQLLADLPSDRFHSLTVVWTCLVHYK